MCDPPIPHGSPATKQMMVRFMYTGELRSDADPEQLLRMIRLADQFQVRASAAAGGEGFRSCGGAHLVHCGIACSPGGEGTLPGMRKH